MRARSNNAVRSITDRPSDGRRILLTGIRMCTTSSRRLALTRDCSFVAEREGYKVP